MSQESWTTEHPDPPPSKPSDWYWFKFDGENEICVIEVWPNRKYWPLGLWGPIAERPKNYPEEKKNAHRSKKPIIGAVKKVPKRRKIGRS